MSDLIAAAIGVPLTFLLGWWGRGKWERYPWNAKPQRWVLPPLELTSTEALRNWPIGQFEQFEQRVAEHTAAWEKAWRSAIEAAYSLNEQKEA